MLRFRYLLLCLMMLALPLQGFAAASMLFCGSGADHDVKVEQMEVASGHHQMAGSMDAQHDHSKHNKMTQAGTQSPDDHKQLPGASHKCSVCAACCSVMAISELPRTVKFQSLPKADLAEPFVLIHAVPSRLPDKPPRV